MTPIKDALEKIAPAVEQLACHQTQLDQDGVMVGVSRQAIDEVVNAINEIAISLTTPAPGRDPWSYQIQHGPDGEANYAWVHDHNGDLVCTAKTHHAKQIVDAILSALPVAPVVDKAAIRADEREKCARIADNHSFGRDIDWWMVATKKDVSAEACRSVAQAIRAGGGER